MLYDGLDRLTAVTRPDPDGVGPQAAPLTRFGYDPVGNLLDTTDPLGRATFYAYDALDRLTTLTAPDPDGVGPQAAPLTRFGYDPVGNRTTTTDPLGLVTTTTYDQLDRPTAITDPRQGQTRLAYDAVGNRTAVTDPVNNTTTFAYDPLDRLTAVTDPLGRATTFAYDAADQLTARTDRRGRQTTYLYDNLGRRTEEQWRNEFGWPVRTIASTYDAAGQLTSVADPDATLSFAYDGLGRLATAATAGTGPGQPNLTLTAAYDAVGNRTRLADDLAGSGGAGAGVTTSTYDALDRLTAIDRTLAGNAGPRVNLGYDAAGRLTTLARTIGGTGTAVNTTFAHDDLDRLTTLTHQVAGGATLASYAYAYDAASRLTRETNAEGTATFTYDDTSQLTGVDRPAGQADEAYGYDLNGNPNTAGSATGTGNRVTASPGFTYTYDFAGNLATKTETASGRVSTYAYDHRNRLTGVTIADPAGAVVGRAAYTYDALDRRIRVQTDPDGDGAVAAATTWTVYDGEHAYADFDGSGALQTRYLHGPAVDMILARTAANGASAWYLTDRLGSVRDVADTAGVPIYHTGYDGFGARTGTSGPGGDRWGFTGREHDAVTDQRYHRARYFDEALDRWTQDDPIGFDAGDPNLARYVGNSPTNYTDPLGLQQEYREGLPTRPPIKWDDGYPYNPGASPAWSDYSQWEKYGFMLNGADLYGHIPDGCRAYRHYRDGNGKDLYVNYDKFYNQDSLGRSMIANEIRRAQHEAERLRRALGKNQFSMTGPGAPVDSGTQNWQKALGGHQIWGAGTVTYDPASGRYRMRTTITAEDYYNFNKGEGDIATGLPDDENGRFETFGWAHGFYSRGSLERDVEWEEGKIPESTDVDGESRCRRDRVGRYRDRRHRTRRGR